MAKPNQYSVDGEQVEFQEILQRTGLARSTIRNRLEKGMRTWASLSESPEKAQRRNRERMRQLMSFERQDREAMKRKAPSP